MFLMVLGVPKNRQSSEVASTRKLQQLRFWRKKLSIETAFRVKNGYFIPSLHFSASSSICKSSIPVFTMTLADFKELSPEYAVPSLRSNSASSSTVLQSTNARGHFTISSTPILSAREHSTIFDSNSLKPLLSVPKAALCLKYSPLGRVRCPFLARCFRIFSGC